jgi:Abi-like protein
MFFSEYEELFSKPRMARYLHAAKGEVELAKKLYRANLAISESFLPLLSAFEVCLRNKLSKQVAAMTGRNDWILREKHGFMADPTLRPSFFLQREVDRAEAKLHAQRRHASAAGILAEQNLGFWVSLFEPAHFKLLRGAPIKIFGKLPTGHRRIDIANALHAIRNFRNRIYHNEPICFDGGRFDLREANLVHAHIQNLSQWMDPYFGAWIKQATRVHKVLGKFEPIKSAA